MEERKRFWDGWRVENDFLIDHSKDLFTQTRTRAQA